MEYMERKPRNYWNYNTCKEAALNCKSRGEFWEKYSCAATLSSKNGWLDDFFRPNTSKPANYWDYKHCYEEAKKYELYSQFRDESFTVYDKCMKNGWIKDFIWLKDNRKKYDEASKIHKIYVYVFNDFNTAYVGRTIQIKQRHYLHTRSKKAKKDSVKEFIDENSITNVSFPIILEDKLTMNESKIREQYWIERYTEMGYRMLNKVKGGSVGGIATKWTEEACYQEAKKYNTKIDFYKNSNSAWVSARKNNWLKEYTWLDSKKRNVWTYDICYEKAKECATLIEFRKKYPQGYRKAYLKKWTNDYVWFNKRKRDYWTEEVIGELISTYTSKKDFKKNEPNAWFAMSRHKWYHLWNELGVKVN